mmetsp:Transcript_1340/g.3125  ORF Transcript_1340/g.3125 Transcript_1340/m.3125 type:complete len:304 (+) Transcript_1340:772-1683(+)
MVADIRQIFSRWLRVMTSRSVMSRKSLSTPRSCTSSMNTCVTVSSSGSVSMRRSSTPVVQNSSCVELPALVSRRMEYPMVPPISSPRSSATRAATPMALMRRGCVHMTYTGSPRAAASSRMYCGTCVVLPHPVSPSMMVTRLAAMPCSSSCRNWYTGRDMRVPTNGPPSGTSGGTRGLGRRSGNLSQSSLPWTVWGTNTLALPPMPSVVESTLKEPPPGAFSPPPPLIMICFSQSALPSSEPAAPSIPRSPSLGRTTPCSTYSSSSACCTPRALRSVTITVCVSTLGAMAACAIFPNCAQTAN